MWLVIVKLWLVANMSVSFADADKVSVQSRSCAARDLKRWDCRLKMGPAVVHVTKDKIVLSDGVWRAVDNIPMDKILEWHQVRLEKLGSRLFLILSFWDQGQGETKIQSRHWIVSEITSVGEMVKSEVRLKQISQRRTPQTDGKFLFDKAEATELKWSKGHVHWRVGRESGEIK